MPYSPSDRGTTSTFDQVKVGIDNIYSTHLRDYVKIWIQWNGTEEEVGERLVEMGVIQHDIVLGFHLPYIREVTDYAVG